MGKIKHKMSNKYKLLFLLFCFPPLLTFSAIPSDTNVLSKNNLIDKVEKINDLAYKTRMSDPALSLTYARLGLSMSLQKGYIKGEINSLVIIGLVYKNIGSYDKAMMSYFTAMRIAESSDDKQRISSCLNNIGSIFQIQGNYLKALKYYNLSLNIEEELGNKEQLSIRLYNIGTVYEIIDSLDMAYAFYYNSLLIEEKLGNKEGIYYALYGIAGIDTKKAHFESARNNINRALQVAHDLNDPLGISVCHAELGKLLMAEKNYRQAVISFDSSVYYARSGNLLNEMKEAYLNLSLANKKTGDIEKAYTNLTHYVEINDSLNNVGIKNRVAELEARFQVDKKEKEITFLRENGVLKTQNAESERRNRNFLLVTIILAMLFTIYNLKKISVNIRKAILLALGILILLFFITFIVFVSGVYTYNYNVQNYFRIFDDVLTYSVLPIFVLIILAERILLNKYIKKANELTAQIKTLNIPDTSKKIDLKFSGKEVAISIGLSELICFEANDNYTAIYFLKNNVVKKELRRITLKKIEDQLADIPEVIRCHKSYIINILNVSYVSGNAQGYKFHLEKMEFAIPVSRNFPQAMIDKIKSTEKS